MSFSLFVSMTVIEVRGKKHPMLSQVMVAKLSSI